MYALNSKDKLLKAWAWKQMTMPVLLENDLSTTMNVLER